MFTFLVGYDPRKDPLAKQYQTVVVCFRRKRFIPEKSRIKAGKAKSISSDIKLPAKTDPREYIYRSGQCLFCKLNMSMTNGINLLGHIPSMRQMW